MHCESTIVHAEARLVQTRVLRLVNMRSKWQEQKTAGISNINYFFLIYNLHCLLILGLYLKEALLSAKRFVTGWFDKRYIVLDEVRARRVW